MKPFRLTLPLILCLVMAPIRGQEAMSATELLDATIAYHDPEGAWSGFRGSMSVTMTSPDRPVRHSTIRLDLPKEVFELEVERGEVKYAFALQADSCRVTFDGKADFSEAVAKEHRLSCERATMYRDYYTYLYGLPMKLKDPGTQLDPKVDRTTFKGKEYLRLKVTYEAEVGDDIWYFYFDPSTYAMEVYQFYHDESANDGEYILLSDIESVGGIRMPKSRAWYYNKDGKHLGTDVLHGND